mgnify:CR=1 FL=1
MAMAAGAQTLWVTIIPCFIWIFAGAPFIDWLDGRPRLRGALAAITAAVVGVIANLSLWFAAHVFFGVIKTIQVGPITTIWPQFTSLDPLAIFIALLAGGLILWRHWSLPLVLLISAATSLIASFLLGSI